MCAYIYEKNVSTCKFAVVVELSRTDFHLTFKWNFYENKEFVYSKSHFFVFVFSDTVCNCIVSIKITKVKALFYFDKDIHLRSPILIIELDGVVP